MSVADSETIDFISLERATNPVVLTIADHLDWSDEAHRIEVLQAKINTYLRFIESGEIEEAYPEARGRSFCIQVRYKEEPSPEGARFLVFAEEVVRAAGFGFEATRFVPPPSE